MDWLTLGAAALAGLMGGVHCAAMCGGIATGFSAMGPRASWKYAAEPNIGRVLGYVLAGAIAGGFGRGIVDLAGSHSFAVGLRMAVGAVMVIIALRLLDRGGRLGFLGAPAAAAWNRLRPLQRRLLPANSSAKRLGLGMLWGWMPCGLSTTLLAAAWLQADPGRGAMTMAAFGLGTLPVMLPLTWSGARIGRKLQQAPVRTAAAAFILISGLLTMAAPWLIHAPVLHGALAALGCLPAGA